MSQHSTLRRSVVLKRRPHGAPQAEDFEIREDAVPQPTAGEVVTRTIWLSIDPVYARVGFASSNSMRSR